jgi:hypothetical protein
MVLVLAVPSTARKAKAVPLLNVELNHSLGGWGMIVVKRAIHVDEAHARK